MHIAALFVAGATGCQKEKFTDFIDFLSPASFCFFCDLQRNGTLQGAPKKNFFPPDVSLLLQKSIFHSFVVPLLCGCHDRAAVIDVDASLVCTVARRMAISIN